MSSQHRVVGELACQRDSYLRTLDTVVIACRERSSKAKPKAVSGKGTPNTAKSSKTEQEQIPQMWEIEFADSVLFPEGGGQPTDSGTLAVTFSKSVDASLPAQPIQIASVERQGLHCVHVSPYPLQPGTLVRQQVDFTRRWDHMQQHTGQHLLSAIMDTYKDLNTIGWGMGSPGEMNYVELPRAPTPDEIQEIQAKCTEIIREDLPITVNIPDDVKTTKLPGDYDKENGVIRVIKIGNLDNNTCCGTHLKQTAHISLVLLHHTQPFRGTNSRLYFTCGDRAINLAISTIASHRSIARTLGSGSSPAEVAEKLDRLNQSLVDIRKREKKLLQETSKIEGERVKALLQAGQNAWTYREDAPMEFFTGVISEIKDVVKDTGLVVLASGEGKKGGQVIIMGQKTAVEEMAKNVKAAVKAIKGGGGGPKWQGKVVEWGKGEVEALRKLVEEP